MGYDENSVGKATLGRIMNVLGRPIDEKGPIEADEYMSIHRAAPTFLQQSAKVELLEKHGSSEPARLLESGDFRLLETGDFRLLE